MKYPTEPMSHNMPNGGVVMGGDETEGGGWLHGGHSTRTRPHPAR